MDNLDIWDKKKEVPQEAQKKIAGGRLKGLTDIKPQWRLLALTELFGPCGIGWYYETIERWIDSVEDSNEISAHVRINLYYKNEGEWSMPVEGQGGSMLVAQEARGPHHSDEAYKMATTDALSVACKQLGIAADIYMGYSTSKYGGNADGNPNGQRKASTYKRTDLMKRYSEITDKMPDGIQQEWDKKGNECVNNQAIIDLGNDAKNWLEAHKFDIKGEEPVF